MAQIRIGQVWADNDKRSAGRTIRVDSFEDDKVVCTVLTTIGGHDAQKGPHPTRPTKIKPSRFRPTHNGYRLVKDVK